MAATIGGVSCTFLKGAKASLKTRVAVWEVPGLDGYGVMTLGKGSAGFAYTAWKIGTDSDVETWVASLEALQGTIVSATDDWNQTRTNLLVESVGAPQKTTELGNGGCICRVAIQGRPVA
jgi:hypothetical protein